MNVTIIGSGAMGAALTFPIAAGGHTPVLYGTQHDTETLQTLKNGYPHPKLNVQLPSNVELREPDELQAALHDAAIWILAVNTQGIVPSMQALLPYCKDSVPLIPIAKGMVEFDGRALPTSAAVKEYLHLHADGDAAIPPVNPLTGPSIASEVAHQVQTIVYLASSEAAQGQCIADALSSSRFHCRLHSDVKGVEICAAYKNLYTIALSWPDGLSKRNQTCHANLKAILFTQTLEEMGRLSVAAGGRAETPWSLAGLGDLLTTDASGRNGTFGELLGEGKSVHAALSQLADQGIHTIEGYESAKLGRRYAQTLDSHIVDHLPLLQAIDRVLHEGATVHQALDTLDLASLAVTQDSRYIQPATVS